MARRGEGLAHRADQQRPDEAAVAEAHFGFGGMDVDVDLAGRAIDEQDGDAMTVARDEIECGGAQGARQQPVARRAAVDEEILRERVRLVEGRQTDPAGNAHAFA